MTRSVYDQEHHDQESFMTTNEDLALPRPVRDSQSEMAEIVLPNDSNVLGALLGGRLMHWIDLAAAMAAHRHSRNYVVTASIDHLDFKVPVHVGDLVILRSSVNRVYRTSMEVGVKVWVENYILDHCEHVSSAYLTFVAVDAAGRHSRCRLWFLKPMSRDAATKMPDGGARSGVWRWNANASPDISRADLRPGPQTSALRPRPRPPPPIFI